MNPSTQPCPWRDGFDRLLSGDLIFFGGTGFLSDGIKAVTHSPVSHAAMVFPPELLPPGSPIQITESTIIGNKNGPQLNALTARLDDDPFVWVGRLSSRVRGFLDWPAIWTVALHKMGHDRYSILQIGEYLLRYVPVVNDLEVLYESIPGEEVCSEYVTQLLAVGGLPGLRPAVTPPQRLAEMRIYSGLLQLRGAPIPLPGFNTT